MIAAFGSSPDLPDIYLTACVRLCPLLRLGIHLRLYTQRIDSPFLLLLELLVNIILSDQLIFHCKHIGSFLQ